MAEFQARVGSPEPARLTALRDALGEAAAPGSRALATAANALRGVEAMLGNVRGVARGDARVLRGKLMVGELAELLGALAAFDEVEAADGLADLEYVTLGTGITIDVPTGPVFDEVHRSNMTKGTGAAAHAGDKGKGPDYSPPAVASAIARARDEEAGQGHLFDRDGRAR